MRTHVVGEAQHDLGSPIPTRRYIFGHEALFLLLVKAASETEVANLELAIGIDKKVARLEIAVKYIGGVNIFETAECLVDEGLEVGIRERLARTDLGREHGWRRRG
jgi:hypothetical protein